MSVLFFEDELNQLTEAMRIDENRLIVGKLGTEYCNYSVRNRSRAIAIVNPDYRDIFNGKDDTTFFECNFFEEPIHQFKYILMQNKIDFNKVIYFPLYASNHTDEFFLELLSDSHHIGYLYAEIDKLKSVFNDLAHEVLRDKFRKELSQELVLLSYWRTFIGYCVEEQIYEVDNQGFWSLREKIEHSSSNDLYSNYQASFFYDFGVLDFENCYSSMRHDMLYHYLEATDPNFDPKNFDL